MNDAEARQDGVVETRPKILLVDDLPANLILLRRLLAPLDAEMYSAASGEEALASCVEHEYAVILLDVDLPDLDGFEVAERLAADARTSDIPVIFVTASHADDMSRLKGYTLGAVDYIAKPINDAILVSKVQVFLRLRLALDQLAERNRLLHAEMKVRELAEAEVRHQATHDLLTGLANRSLFMDRMQTALERARRRDKPFGLAYIDIDGFKSVNDTHGHHVGDELLRHIAGRLQASLRLEDTIARLGGDEFAVIMEDAVDERAMATRLCDQIIVALREPYALTVGGTVVAVQVGASVGLALYPEHGTGIDELVIAADSAMYRAKREGKNRCAVAGEA